MTIPAPAILTGDCRRLMPSHGPFGIIFADPPYGDTSLVWDRRVEGSLRCFMARKAAELPPSTPSSGAAFTARLTIDVAPDLRGRIKIAAFQRGVTVADMLRELLAREFPQTSGDPS